LSIPTVNGGRDGAMPATVAGNSSGSSAVPAQSSASQPQWAMDSLGFFVTLKDAEGVYPPSGHQLPPAAAERIVSAGAPAARCAAIADAVTAQVEWWRVRARELDCSAAEQHGACAAAAGADAVPAASDAEPQEPLGPWRRQLLHEIRARVRRGALSPAERGAAWPLMGGLEFDRAARLERCIANLRCRGIDSEFHDVMKRDLPRTLPTHSMFRGAGSVGQQRLERVLLSYCALDPEVSYVQGQGFIVSILLLHMPEADAFGLFVQMMQGRRFQMRDLYRSGFPLLQRMLELFRRLLRLVAPQLMEHFDVIGVDPAFFASHWFLTLFAYQLSVPVVCRIWDLFFSEGWVWIFRVGIALLLAERATLVTMPMEEVLMRVKAIHEGRSAEEIVRMARDVPIRESDLVAIEAEPADAGDAPGDYAAAPGVDVAARLRGEALRFP
jgi:hypothetical protein